MVQHLERSVNRPRISIAVDPEFQRRLRLGAAKRDQSVAQYVRDAVERHLGEDLAPAHAPLSAYNDPVLAELWDNEHDAAYDDL